MNNLNISPIFEINKDLPNYSDNLKIFQTPISNFN